MDVWCCSALLCISRCCSNTLFVDPDQPCTTERPVLSIYINIFSYLEDLEWLLLSQQAVVQSYRARYLDINLVSMLQIEKYLYNKCTRCILAQLLSSQNDHIHCNFYSSVFSSLTLVKISWIIKSRSRAD